MGIPALLERVTGSLSDAYVTRARDKLGSDAVLTGTRNQWAPFVRATRGNVFATLDGEEPEAIDRTFCDALYVDFVVDSLLDALADATGVTLANRDPSRNTAPEVSFGDCHDRVLPPADGRDRIQSAVSPADLRTLGPDDLRDISRAVVADDRRLALGEYYTPEGLAALAVTNLSLDDGARVLDPGCGTGAFLTACLDRIADEGTEGEPLDCDDLLERCTNAVVGFDLDPVAVKAAKLAYLCRLFDALEATDRDELAVPVFLTDALALTQPVEIEFRGEQLDLTFDSLVGNPPWIPWQRVSDRVKDELRAEYVTELGLQPHSGMDARLGHSNDDLAVPFAWVCIHRYLEEGGTAAFVLKRDSMRGPAGAVLRALRVGDRSLSLRHVHDFGAVDPFPDVGANAALYTFVADRSHSFPIPTTVWTALDGIEPQYGDLHTLRETLDAEETELRPLDRSDSTSAWVRADAERAALGACAHEIRHGLKDDANAVFGLDRSDLSAVDADLVYPYVTSRHVQPYGLSGHDLRLVPMRQAGEDNEDWLRETYPDTYEYLRGHRSELADRSSSWLDDGPFYNVFGLGKYTWADYRVAWCRLGFKPAFAVVSTRDDPDLGERHVVPGDHYMFVATDDWTTAHALCALLNSAPYQRTLRDITSGGKASLSKSTVSELALPPIGDIPDADRLAALSSEAHDLVENSAHEGNNSRERKIEEIQSVIDGVAESMLATASNGFQA